MTRENLIIFTLKSVNDIVQAGGTQGWVLDPVRAKQCQYAVLCRNSRKSSEREVHGSAFMVGRISGVVPATGRDGRWLVTFDEYAIVDEPDTWKGWRNPVRYETELPFSIDGVEFKPMPEPKPTAERAPAHEPPSKGRVKGLTIEEAKNGLAATFGVKPDAVEITIRG